jgi:hypothetical protein
LAPQGERGALKITGDYHKASQGVLAISLEDGNKVAVSGRANLAGRLEVNAKNGWESAPGKSYPVLTAREIRGAFSNPKGVVASDSFRFRIRYADAAVELVAE